MNAERTWPILSVGELVEVGALLLDERGWILSANAHAQALLSHEPLAGHGLGEMLALDPEALALVAQVLRGELGRVTVDVKAPRQGVDRQLTVEPMPDSAGPLFLALLVDTHGYLADRRARAQVELRSTIESIIGGFAHEVRNPLASILSLTEAAIEEWAERSMDPTDLMRIPALVSRIERLLQQSLAYGRPKPPQKRVHPLDALLNETAQLLRPPTRAKLLLPRPDPEVAFRADLQQLSQVLINLLENAGDVARAEIQVRWSEVEAGPAGPLLRVDVSDDGPGVPPELHGRIFDPFFTTKAHGSGLGLAIARDLARLNGGDLKLTTAQGPTTFSLTLPLARRGAPVEAR